MTTEYNQKHYLSNNEQKIKDFAVSLIVYLWDYNP